MYSVRILETIAMEESPQLFYFVSRTNHKVIEKYVPELDIIPKILRGVRELCTQTIEYHILQTIHNTLRDIRKIIDVNINEDVKSELKVPVY